MNRTGRCDRYREDSFQLLLVDLAVAVLVEQLEVPFQFLVDFSLQHQTDGSDVLHEIDVAVLSDRREGHDIISC